MAIPFQSPIIALLMMSERRRNVMDDSTLRQNIIDELFACSTPNVSPGGRFTFISFKLNDLERMFERGA